MDSENIEMGAAVSRLREGKAAREGEPAAGQVPSIAPEPQQRSEPAVEIERTLEVDPTRGIARIGIEALEGLLAGLGADDALTLRLAPGDEAAPVRIGLVVSAGEDERQQAHMAALDLAAGLIKTERRA
jgi:hypothetical protein